MKSFFSGADDEARTRYLHLGKVALYQMSYIRISRCDGCYYNKLPPVCQEKFSGRSPFFQECKFSTYREKIRKFFYNKTAMVWVKSHPVFCRESGYSIRMILCWKEGFLLNEPFKNKKRTLGDNLKEARLRKGLLQSDVASALHLERSTYTSYETGRTSPSAETLFKLSAIYETPVIELLGSDFSSSASLHEPSHSEYTPNSPAPSIYRLQPKERELLEHFQALTEERQNKLLKLVRKIHVEQVEEEKAAKSNP